MKHLMKRLRNRSNYHGLNTADRLVKNKQPSQIWEKLHILGNWVRRYGLDAILVIVLMAIAAQTVLLAFNQFRSNYPIKGTKFESYSIDSLSGDQLVAKIKTVLDGLDQQSVVIKVGNYRAHLTARQLGAVHDNLKYQQKILKLGRQGNLLQRLVDQDTALLGKRNFKDSFNGINRQLASTYLEKVNTQVQVMPLNASFAYQNQQVVVQAGKAGLEINIDQAITALQSVDSSKSGLEINLPVSYPQPTVTQQELQPLLPQVRQVVAKPLTIVGGDKKVRLESSQLTALLQPEKKPDPTSPNQQVVAITYNDAKLSAVLDQLAAQVVVPAQPKIVSGQKVISPGSQGVHLDGTHAKVEVISELEKRQLQSTASPAPESTSQPTAPPTTPPASQPANPPTAPPSPTPKPTPQPVQPTPSPVPSTTQPVTTPTSPEPGDSVIVPVEKIDPPVINQQASANPLGRYPATVNGKNMIYLTIDDGPGAYTEQLLDILKTYKVHAIFFLIGKNTVAYPQTVKRLQTEGHTIGNHSYTHSNLASLSEAAINDELVKTQSALRSITGLTPDLFRPPYGSLSTSVYNTTAKNGLNIMMWSIDPRDWSQPGVSVIVQRVVSAAAPGANILLHSNHKQTVDALPSIIESLKAKGYSLP